MAENIGVVTIISAVLVAVPTIIFGSIVMVLAGGEYVLGGIVVGGAAGVILMRLYILWTPRFSTSQSSPVDCF